MTDSVLILPNGRTAQRASMREIGEQYDVDPVYGSSKQGDRLNRMDDHEWYDVIREMTEQDPTIGAIMFAIEMTLRRVQFRVEPANDTPEAARWSEFVSQCIDDMESPWPSKLSEIISFVPFGFSFFEIVYKRRLGMSSRRISEQSRYNDGLIGWKKWSYRSPESKDEWVYQNGDLVGFKQRRQDYSSVVIPMNKAVLFQSGSRYSDPEGVSVLRRAYHPWRMKREIENVEAIGVYRDLAGLFEIRAPSKVVRGRGEDARIRESLLKTIRNVHRGLQEGILMPSDRGPNGELQYEARLMTSGGARQFDTNMIIERYRTDEAMTLMADFILIGHQHVGTYALSESKSNMFNRSMNSWLDTICMSVNEQPLRYLMEVNGVPPDLWPFLTHTDPDRDNVAQFASAVAQLAGVGGVIINEGVVKAIHEMIGLPPPNEDEDDGTNIVGG